MSFVFDTLVQARRLREAGFDEKQAEALTTALRDAAPLFDVATLATKADFDALKADVATKADLDVLRADTKVDLAALRADTKADLAALKADVASKTEFAAGLAALKADVVTKAEFAAGLATLKADLLQWMIGLVVGAVVFNAFVVIGSVLGLAKLLGH
jgi:hypothetical protein